MSIGKTYIFSGSWSSDKGSSTPTTIKTGKVEDGDNLKYYAIYTEKQTPKLNINFTGNCGTHACMEIILYISKTPTSVENNYSFKKSYTITKSPFTDTVELKLDNGEWYIVTFVKNIRTTYSTPFAYISKIQLDSSTLYNYENMEGVFGPWNKPSDEATYTLNIPYTIKV